MEPADFILFILIGAIAAVMAMYGGIVSSTKRSQRWAFGILGLLSVGLIIWQAIRVDKSLTKANNDQNQRFAKLNESLENAKKEIAKLRTEVEVPVNVKRRRQIADQLRIILREGDSLDTKCLNESLSMPRDEVNKWIKKAEQVVSASFDKEYVARLGDGAGLNLVIPVADDERSNLCAQVKIRTKRLDEFIAKLRE